MKNAILVGVAACGFALPLVACTGGGGSLSDLPDMYQNHPGTREAPPNGREAPPPGREVPPPSQDKPKNTAENPGSFGGGTGGGGGGGTTGSCPPCDRKFDCTFTRGTQTGSDDLTLKTTNGECTTADGEVTFECGGNITAQGQTAGTWSVSGSTLTGSVSGTTFTCNPS